MVLAHVVREQSSHHDYRHSESCPFEGGCGMGKVNQPAFGGKHGLAVVHYRSGTFRSEEHELRVKRGGLAGIRYRQPPRGGIANSAGRRRADSMSAVLVNCVANPVVFHEA